MCLKLSDINPQNIYPRHRYVKNLTTSPWLPPIVFTFYRLVVGLYCLAGLIFCSYHYNSKWFLYISNWIFIFIAAHFLLGSILSLFYSLSVEAQEYEKSASSSWESEPFIKGFSGYNEDEKLKDKTTWREGQLKTEDQLHLSHKILWVTFTIASVGALQITLIYWSVFYNNQGINGVNVTFLIFNSIFVTIELLISNIPVVVLHFFYSHAVQSIYILFTVLYWAFGGTDGKGHRYIYKAFDYEREPTWAIICVFLYVVIFQFVAHLYCLSLFHFRKWLVRMFKKSL